MNHSPIAVIVPAFNEEKVIAGTLEQLLRDAKAGEFEVTVVCNGCNDQTANAAKEASGDINVIELTEASKTAAINAGLQGVRSSKIVLLDSDRGAPLFMQFKEATQSVLEPYAGTREYEQAGERVVRGQRLLQSTGDILLGWSHSASKDTGATRYYYFRQLWDGKGSADVDEMGGRRLRGYAKLCGGVLAIAHARSGDASMIAGYLGEDETFDHAVAAFANEYADLTERDHETHLAAINSGRIQAIDDIG